MKLWINETEAIDLDQEVDLSGEVATRQRYTGWIDILGSLPDPDPVLRALGGDAEILRNLLADGHVWSCYASRKAGTLSREWEINAAADGGSEGANNKALDLAREVMTGIKVRQVISDILDAPFYGFSPIEVVWQSTDGWLPERMTGKPAEWFSFDNENHLLFNSAENATEGERVPEMKFILCSHHASYLNPYGERLLSKCFWPVTFKKGGFKFWAIFMEKFGMPWPVGKVPRSTGDADRQALLSRLAAMVQDAVAVINNDESVEFAETKGTKASGDLYQGMITTCNREISKAILSQTLSTELDKGGSMAATKGHLEIRDDIVDADCDMVKTAFNTLFAWITEFNVPGAAPPEFSFVEDEDVQTDRSERDNNLSTQGVKFTPKYYMRIYNLEADDFEIRGRDDSESRDPDNPEFSESATPDLADHMAGQLERETGGAMDALIQPISRLVANAKTYDEIQEGLADLYPDMDGERLAELLGQTMAAAELGGRYEADEGL